MGAHGRTKGRHIHHHDPLPKGVCRPSVAAPPSTFAHTCFALGSACATCKARKVSIHSSCHHASMLTLLLWGRCDAQGKSQLAMRASAQPASRGVTPTPSCARTAARRAGLASLLLLERDDTRSRARPLRAALSRPRRVLLHPRPRRSQSPSRRRLTSMTHRHHTRLCDRLAGLPVRPAPLFRFFPPSWSAKADTMHRGLHLQSTRHLMQTRPAPRHQARSSTRPQIMPFCSTPFL